MLIDRIPKSLCLPRNTSLSKLGGTDTFRLASTSLFDYGTNLTNIEKSVRRIYWADKGKCLVQTDQAGAEALIVAYLCRAGRFRELFLHGVKPHVFVGMHMFLDTWKTRCKDIDIDGIVQTPIALLKTKQGWKELESLIKSSDNWAAHERYYFIAKQACHSSNYAAREDAFRINALEKSKGKVVLSKKQAADILMKYHSMFPEIHEWHRDLQRTIERDKIIYNLQGFPRIITEWPIHESHWKEYYAWPAQSTVGCITHIAITRMQQYIEDEKLDWDIPAIGNGHDSIVTQCPTEERIHCGRKQKEFIEQELTSPRGELFRMKSETQCGLNWSPESSYNPDGLQELVLN